MNNQELFRQLFHYNKDTGVITNATTRGSRAKIGNIAGGIENGYRRVSVQSKSIGAHNIIYIMHNGDTPKGLEVDHIDHNRQNNRIENLRLVTRLENNHNKTLSKRNKSGTHGVRRIENGKWRVVIMSNRKKIHLGYFHEKDEAIRARKQAEIKYGYHKNHGIKL